MHQTYQLVGTVAEKYKYIGNGVPVELATAVAGAIAKSFASTHQVSLTKPMSTKTIEFSTPSVAQQLSLF